MRRPLIILLTAMTSLLVAAGAAQAVVLNDAGTTAGVALVPGTNGESLPSGVSAVTSSGPCTDPALSHDLGGPLLPGVGLCYHGGAVMHKNETFALTWDAHRAYWAATRGYVEQFLRDVADGSGTLTSPFAVTTQYTDGGGRAQNASLYGGGCIDYGAVGGSACEYGSPTGAGHDYPATNGCVPRGDSFISTQLIQLNTACFTDAQLQNELSTMITQTGIIGRTAPGYTPLVTLLLPAGVETCLDAAGHLCSTNSGLTPPPPAVSANATGGTIPAGTYHVVITYVTASGESFPSAAQTVITTGGTSTITVSSPPSTPGVTGWYAYAAGAGGTDYSQQESSGPSTIGSDLTLTNITSGGAQPPTATAFCSYHSQVTVGGANVAYLVLPWSAGTECDETDAPTIPENPTPEQLSVDVGSRLVSPLSQSQIAAIVNPGLNGWSALNGSEINDNRGCVPLSKGLDNVTVGKNAYVLQREFNNAGVLEIDPFTYFGCAPNVLLIPTFVVPSAVNSGDVVEFDGSPTGSTLIVPNAGYAWSFGDGTGAVGPSVVHSYSKSGTYRVTLTVTDRGGNVRSLTQSIAVLGKSGQVTTSKPTSKGLKAHLTLMPQSLRSALHGGVAVAVSANETADGIATVSITRGTAGRAHIKHGRGASVVIGRGTVSGVKAGTVKLHLRLPHGIASHLGRLHHLTLTVRLTLVAAGGAHVAIDAAGRY